MKLSNMEKEEMLRDGNNPHRRNDFASVPVEAMSTLDEYLDFLAAFQKIFPSGPLNRSKTITSRNKL
mgnify:CR=1 FL=1